MTKKGVSQGNLKVVGKHTRESQKLKLLANMPTRYSSLTLPLHAPPIHAQRQINPPIMTRMKRAI